MITREEVLHVAKLARISLSQKEIKKLQKDLSGILNYAQTLKEVDITRVSPTSRAVFVENVMRRDSSKKEDPEVIKEMVSQAPDKKEDFIKVKQVLE